MSDDLQKILHTAEVTSSDKQVAKIESDLQKEKDDRRTERFFFAFMGLILLDSLIFAPMSWAGIFGMVILELLFIILFGSWCGIDQVYHVTINILDRLAAIRGKKTE